MKPIIKWQGGKRKELPHIRPFIPDNISNIAEPFCGGAAVAFDNEGIAHLNDNNCHLINLYQVLQSSEHFDQMMSDINKVKADLSCLEKLFYSSRAIVNTYDFSDPYKAAFAFLVLRQQCFSGMERYNRQGGFNVPWGRYKTFSCGLSIEHHHFLKAATLSCLDAVDFIDTLPADTFLFIDPPYIDRLGYKHGDGGLDLHSGLAAKLKTCDLPFLLIHSDDDFYRHAYADFNITEVDFKYSQQFKGREMANSKVTHLYISNVSPISN